MVIREVVLKRILYLMLILIYFSEISAFAKCDTIVTIIGNDEKDIAECYMEAPNNNKCINNLEKGKKDREEAFKKLNLYKIEFGEEFFFTNKKGTKPCRLISSVFISNAHAIDSLKSIIDSLEAKELQPLRLERDELLGKIEEKYKSTFNWFHFMIFSVLTFIGTCIIYIIIKNKFKKIIIKINQKRKELNTKYIEEKKNLDKQKNEFQELNDKHIKLKQETDEQKKNYENKEYDIQKKEEKKLKNEINKESEESLIKKSNEKIFAKFNINDNYFEITEESNDDALYELTTKDNDNAEYKIRDSKLKHDVSDNLASFMYTCEILDGKWAKKSEITMTAHGNAKNIGEHKWKITDYAKIEVN